MSEIGEVLATTSLPFVPSHVVWSGNGQNVAALGFLGLGAQPPDPEWGLMIRDGFTQFLRAPWMSIFPGIAIFLAVVGFNLLGDAIRDVLDPRLRDA